MLTWELQLPPKIGFWGGPGRRYNQLGEGQRHLGKVQHPPGRELTTYILCGDNQGIYKSTRRTNLSNRRWPEKWDIGKSWQEKERSNMGIWAGSRGRYPFLCSLLPPRKQAHENINHDLCWLVFGCVPKTWNYARAKQTYLNKYYLNEFKTEERKIGHWGRKESG